MTTYSSTITSLHNTIEGRIWFVAKKTVEEAERAWFLDR
jgi:hypothetical protein